MGRLAAAVVVGGVLISTATIGASASIDRALALQAHRAADHQAPEHHLREARRALDRAWQKSSGDDRRSLDALRADFAALSLAYARIPSEPRTGNEPPAAVPPGASGTAGTADANVPPKTAGVPPPSAATAKPLAAWQQKYADVEQDLKVFQTGDCALKTRVDHVRTHLEMFYASALGKSR